ncbi:hypothetical protein [Pedobacter alpinus]|uniref:Uncharacterized protein n=1 Tax=Pedobacter alpinus TaxID=1590643 RepID=A0ABW5TR23_9SPHI
MFGYIAGGTLIGAASGGAAAGISAAGGGAILAGFGAGSLGGAGFNGLATGWNVNSMLKGAVIGGISGAVGGGFAAAIGGGGGALVGGTLSSLAGQFLTSGDFNLGQALLNGGLSLALFHGVSYGTWKWGGGSSLGQQNLSYRQYLAMQADFQKSRFWGKEYGGFLMDDGRVIRFPRNWRHSHGIDPPGGGGFKPLTGTKAIYHTHWDKPGKQIFVDALGNRTDNAQDLSVILKGKITTTARGHGAYDYLKNNSFVVNRFETTFNIGNTTTLFNLDDTFLRFLLFFKTWNYTTGLEQ